MERGRWIGLAAAVPLGAILAFFFVLAPLFTDGPQALLDPERLVSVAVTALAFVVAASLVAWVARGDRWCLFALGSPGVAIAVWYVLREPGVAELATAYVAVVAIALVSGRLVGLRLRSLGDGDA